MAICWQYALLSLDADGQGAWGGQLFIEGQKPQRVSVSGLSERLTFLNTLGRERLGSGWAISEW